MKFKSKELTKPAHNDFMANRISKGTLIEGELIAETDIRVDGKIKGVLQCSSKVVIGQSGELEGDIQCKEATIEGKVSGRLDVNGLLYLKRSAIIDGDVSYKRLIVEEGAVIAGTLVMSGGTTKQLIYDNGQGVKRKSFEASQTA